LYEYIVSLNGDIIRNSLPIEPLKLNKKSSFQYLLIGRKNNEDKRRNLKNNIFLPAKDQNTSRFHCKLKVENCSLFLFDSIKLQIKIVFKSGAIDQNFFEFLKGTNDRLGSSIIFR